MHTYMFMYRIRQLKKYIYVYVALINVYVALIKPASTSKYHRGRVSFGVPAV